MFEKLIGSMHKTEFGIKASEINVKEIPMIDLPDQIRDEVPTMNKFGYMKEEFDEFSADFIDYAQNKDDIVLELGTAYGWIARNALKEGIKIIANDISIEHLLILIKEAEADYLQNLYLYPGRFPDEIELPTESIGAVLTSRMFHFLDEKAVDLGLRQIHSWLKQNGKLFFTSLSPYNYTLKDNFLPIFQARAKQGVKWCGIVDDMTRQAPEHAEYLNDFLHVFDVPQLEEILPEYGFKIDKIKLFDYGNCDSNGIGHIGFVATKI